MIKLRLSFLVILSVAFLVYFSVLPISGSKVEEAPQIGKVVDFQTLEDDTVTVRDRDTGTQERVSIDKLSSFFHNKLLS